MKKLLVYGTLMNINRLKEFGIAPSKVEDATINGRLYRAGFYPIFVDSPVHIVHGKLLTIENLDAHLTQLDCYEGCYGNNPDSLFLREIRKVRLENREEDAYVYVGNLRNEFVREKCREENLIRGGRWKL